MDIFEYMNGSVISFIFLFYFIPTYSDLFCFRLFFYTKYGIKLKLKRNHNPNSKLGDITDFLLSEQNNLVVRFICLMGNFLP